MYKLHRVFFGFGRVLSRTKNTSQQTVKVTIRLEVAILWRYDLLVVVLCSTILVRLFFPRNVCCVTQRTTRHTQTTANRVSKFPWRSCLHLSIQPNAVRHVHRTSWLVDYTGTVKRSKRSSRFSRAPWYEIIDAQDVYSGISIFTHKCVCVTSLTQFECMCVEISNCKMLQYLLRLHCVCVNSPRWINVWWWQFIHWHLKRASDTMITPYTTISIVHSGYTWLNNVFNMTHHHKITPHLYLLLCIWCIESGHTIDANSCDSAC